jgi:hypothetical protein
MRTITFAPRSLLSLRWLSPLALAACAGMVACSEGEPPTNPPPRMVPADWDSPVSGCVRWRRRVRIIRRAGRGRRGVGTGGTLSVGHPANGGAPNAGAGGSRPVDREPAAFRRRRRSRRVHGQRRFAGQRRRPYRRRSEHRRRSGNRCVANTGGASTGGARIQVALRMRWRRNTVALPARVAPEYGGAPSTGGVPNTGGARTRAAFRTRAA